MVINNFTWKIGGEAGYGIMASGAMFSRVMLRAGLFVFDYPEYPSLIRGGNNTYQVRASEQPIHSPSQTMSLLVALNKETVDLYKHELSADAGVIYNTDTSKLDDGEVKPNVKLFPVPLDSLAEKSGGSKIMRNTVAIGASLALLGADFKILEDVINLTFGAKKGKQAVAEINVKAARAGYDYIKKNFPEPFGYKVEARQNPGRLILNGNEALVWGAIRAGCKFLAAYPMTPASSILHLMASEARNYNIVVEHVEDEIAAINMAAGAAYTGVRAMTSTAGGGFSLMVETLGMAAMLEIPLVIMEAMRPGPSTGMPTWTSQGDLKFILSASQDEFPRFVIAPGDVEQCFSIMIEAFNLAEKYQTPVLVMTDKFLAESRKWLDNLDLSKVGIERGDVLTFEKLAKIDDYRRYLDTKTGISPRSLPGTPSGEYIANSDEHNEKGFSDESSEYRILMMDKRLRKMETALKDIPEPILEGDKNADLTVISWGSTRGPILDALEELKKEKITVNYLPVVYLNPFPEKKISQIMGKAKKVAVLENNKEGQLASLITEKTGLFPDYKLLKYDGRPFFPEEIVKSIKEIL